jgi:hypothetical protein
MLEEKEEEGEEGEGGDRRLLALPRLPVFLNHCPSFLPTVTATPTSSHR